jgi:hypothetical protein
VLTSRLACLPDGPWEQDEALFAHGVLDFDIAHHSPHPPGFPGWIAVGKLMAIVVGDSLRGLQVASALASTLLFVALARLLAPRHGATAAVGGALVFALLPVSWFHAARAFSTTPALACIAGALLLWRAAGQDRGAWAGWGLLGLASTIRPQLLPMIALVAAAEAWKSRARPRRLWPGVLLAAAVSGALYGGAIADTGGWRPYLALAVEHLERHRADVSTAQALGWTDHGLVRGLGGPFPAAAWSTLALAGTLRLVRTRKSEDRFVVTLALVTAATIQLLQPPAFPRYAVATAAATTPLVVAGLAWLPARATGVVLAGMSIAAATLAWPSVWAIHRAPIPIMSALASLDDDAMADAPIFHSHGSFSFVRYARASGLFEREIVDTGESAPTPVGPYYYVGGNEGHTLPGLTVTSTTFDEFPDSAWSLSQRRFARAFVVRNAVWMGAGAHDREHGERGEPFVWLGEQAVLHVPGGAERLVLQLGLDQRMQPQEIRARIGKHEVAVFTYTEPGLWRMEIPLARCGARCRVRLAIPRARPREDDRRLLSVRVRAAWVEGSGFPIPRRTWSPGLPGSLLASDVELTGFHRADVFMKRRAPGAWTAGHATIRFPAGPGRLRLSVARPKHLVGPVHLRWEEREISFEPGALPEDVWIDVAAPDDELQLEIDAPTFVPSARDPASTDHRELGLIVLDAEFVPARG